MMNFLAAAAFRGAALAGAVVVTCAVARGLVRAARAAASGDHERVVAPWGFMTRLSSPR